MVNTFRFKEVSVTEAAGVTLLNEETLGYRPDGLYSHHAITWSALGGGDVVTKIELMNPAGGFTELPYASLTNDDVLIITPYKISIMLATKTRTLALWAATDHQVPIMGWRSRVIRITTDSGAATTVTHVRSEASANFGG